MGTIDALGEHLEVMKADLTLCKAAVVGGTLQPSGPKIKVPEPPSTKGKETLGS